MNGAPWVLGLAGLAALAGATRRGSANKAAPAAVVAEAKRDAVAFRAEVARWLKGTTAQQREDFELNWREPEIRSLFGARVLGYGNFRLALSSRDPRFVIKLAMRPSDNLDEAGAWEDAGPRTKAMLVPVVAHDPEGHWLVMERVTPYPWDEVESDDLRSLRQRAGKVGLRDVHPDNVSTDLRLLDYAEPVSLKGSPARQGSRATFTTGYCLAFAKVLKKRLGREAKLYDVVEPDAPGSAYMFSGTPHHAVVAWHGLFLDADGAFTEGELLARWNERAPRQVRRPLRLEPHHAGRAKDVNLKSACPLHLMASAEAVAAKVETQARRRVEQKGSRAKLKPPTLRDLGLPTVWFHGTKASFAGKLRPNKGMGGACVWLADEAGARAYAGQGPTARLVRVELDPSMRVADLADARDPIVRDFIRRDRSASNLRWHNREEVTDEEMVQAVASWQRRTTHYDAIESRGWAKDFFRKAGVDALLVRDVQGWGGHQSMPSLCVLNRAKIAREQDVVAR